MRSIRLLTVAAAAAATLPIAACGGSGGDPDADPAAIVPSRAPVYVEAKVNPKGDDVNELAKKLVGTENPGAEIKKAIEREAKSEGTNLDFEKDVDPWLGDRVGLFLSKVGPGDASKGAVVLSLEDADKGEKFLEKQLREPDEKGGPKPKVVTRKYKDSEYLVDTNDDNAVVITGDYAIQGNEDGVKGALDAKEGESIADNKDFKSARDTITDKDLGVAYFRFTELFSGLGSQGAAARQAFAAFGDSAIVGLDADSDKIKIESAALGVSEQAAGSGPGAVLPELPGSSWLAAGTADFGARLNQAIDQAAQGAAASGVDAEQLIRQIEQQTGLNPRRDLAAWMGDMGLFVYGDTLQSIGGGLVAQSKNPAATRRAIPKIARIVRSQGFGVEQLNRGGARGVTLTSPQLPLPIHMALAGDRFIVAVTNPALDQALKPTEALRDSAAFKSAQGSLGDGMQPSMFVNFDPISKLVDQSGSVNNQEARQFKKALDAMTTMVAGGKSEGDTQRGRIVVGVK